jgi:hypothetical protein
MQKQLTVGSHSYFEPIPLRLVHHSGLGGHRLFIAYDRETSRFDQDGPAIEAPAQ